MKKWDCRVLSKLFISFFKISPVTFGGGYAIIPLIEKEVLKHRKWMSKDELSEVLAVAQSVPGAIAVNSAIVIGYRVAGIIGALVALVGVILPAFFIVMGLCVAFFRVREQAWIAGALEGIRASVVALIIYAAIRMGKTCIMDKLTWGLLGATVGALILFHLNPIWVLFCGAVFGMVVAQGKKLWRLVKERQEQRYSSEWKKTG
jgi:chromate transporter